MIKFINTLFNNGFIFKNPTPEATPTPEVGGGLPKSDLDAKKSGEQIVEKAADRNDARLADQKMKTVKTAAKEYLDSSTYGTLKRKDIARYKKEALQAIEDAYITMETGQNRLLFAENMLNAIKKAQKYEGSMAAFGMLKNGVRNVVKDIDFGIGKTEMAQLKENSDEYVGSLLTGVTTTTPNEFVLVLQNAGVTKEATNYMLDLLDQMQLPNKNELFMALVMYRTGKLQDILTASQFDQIKKTFESSDLSRFTETPRTLTDNLTRTFQYMSNAVRVNDENAADLKERFTQYLDGVDQRYRMRTADTSKGIKAEFIKSVTNVLANKTIEEAKAGLSRADDALKDKANFEKEILQSSASSNDSNMVASKRKYLTKILKTLG